MSTELPPLPEATSPHFQVGFDESTGTARMGYFTPEQMRYFGSACWDAAIEAASNRLDAVGCDHCAENIRALKGKA